MNKVKVWVEPLFGEGKQWHGMARFRLRRLWRVNCEDLVIASGQNLKRLLQKRGWGRRPFPTEAVALRPPGSSETETFPRNQLRKSQRASVAVASLASWKVVRTFFAAQRSLFPLRNIVIFLFFILSFAYFYFLLFFLFLLVTPCSGKALGSQAQVFPEKRYKE